jgi:hypothetical protein
MSGFVKVSKYLSDGANVTAGIQPKLDKGPDQIGHYGKNSLMLNFIEINIKCGAFEAYFAMEGVRMRR